MKNSRLIFLFLTLTILTSCKSKNDSFAISVFQNGKSISKSEGYYILDKSKFSFIFSFPNIPKQADTSLGVLYIATSDSSIIDYNNFNSSKEVFHEMIGDSIPSWISRGAVGAYNDSEEIFNTVDYKSGYHNILYIDKVGSQNKVSHSFNNVDRVGDKLNAWYSVKIINGRKIEELTNNSSTYIFFSNPDLNKKGIFIKLKFN